MASVVFFRAVNVGGHQRFHPSQLARDLAEYGVVNVAAAGTFVVRGNVSEKKLRDEVLRRLAFQPELVVCPAREVLELMQAPVFDDGPPEEHVRRFASVMLAQPRSLPPLPLEQPVGHEWEVRVVAVIGRFALSLGRPGRTRVYSNEVVEKRLGVPATTRNWNTIAAVCDILKPGRGRRP